MSFPGSLDNIASVSSGQLITSAFINSLVNAVNALESSVGVNPSRSLCECRLTLSTGVPVPASDVTGATTVYLTPFLGNRIALFDGSGAWAVLALSADLSLALGTLVAGTNYDIFCYNNSGTPALELGAAWTNDTTRSTGLVLQDGIPVKSGATTRRYLGTLRTTSTTTTEDSASRRFLFNMYHPVARHLLVQNVSSPTTSSATWASVASTTASFLMGYQAGSVQYRAIANAGSHSVQNTLSSFGAGLNGSNPTSAAYSSVHSPAAGYDFCFTPPSATAYSSLGYNSLTAYAQTAAGTLTLVNPGISGVVEM